MGTEPNKEDMDVLRDLIKVRALDGATRSELQSLARIYDYVSLSQNSGAVEAPRGFAVQHGVL